MSVVEDFRLVEGRRRGTTDVTVYHRVRSRSRGGPSGCGSFSTRGDPGTHSIPTPVGETLGTHSHSEHYKVT